MAFEGAHPELARTLAERGYGDPTLVQASVLEARARGRDLLVSAQTGSGKTVAFGLVLAHELLGAEPHFPPARQPLALVVAPTRELAIQVQRELEWLFASTRARVVSCVGGMDPHAERRALQQGAHIVVGTPGRLADHVEREQLDLSKLRAVVLDEADEMLDMGFREEIEMLLETVPTDRRTLLFSATIPPDIARLAKKFQRDALRIVTAGEDEPHGDIEYRAVLVAPHERERAIVNLLRFLEMRGALVFCATRDAVARLHANLLERGFSVVALSGEMNQNERTRALQSLRDARARVCVATDVAARGLDIPDLGLVLHADLPRSPDVLKHRSGRTGRAGRKGLCIVLVPYPARRRAERMLQVVGVQAVWGPPPSADEIRAKDRERLVDELAALAADVSEEDLAAGRVLLERRTPEALAAALVRLQRSLHPAPEELSQDGGAPRERRDPTDTVWFRMSVGRDRNADPRWLIPFLCRRGHVTKAEIGKIRIGERDTQFEIDRRSADRFAAAVRHPDQQDGDIAIEPLRGPPGDGGPRRGPHGPGRGHPSAGGHRRPS